MAQTLPCCGLLMGHRCSAQLKIIPSAVASAQTSWWRMCSEDPCLLRLRLFFTGSGILGWTAFQESVECFLPYANKMTTWHASSTRKCRANENHYYYQHVVSALSAEAFKSDHQCAVEMEQNYNNKITFRCFTTSAYHKRRYVWIWLPITGSRTETHAHTRTMSPCRRTQALAQTMRRLSMKPSANKVRTKRTESQTNIVLSPRLLLGMVSYATFVSKLNLQSLKWQ